MLYNLGHVLISKVDCCKLALRAMLTVVIARSDFKPPPYKATLLVVEALSVHALSTKPEPPCSSQSSLPRNHGIVQQAKCLLALRQIVEINQANRNLAQLYSVSINEMQAPYFRALGLSSISCFIIYVGSSISTPEKNRSQWEAVVCSQKPLVSTAYNSGLL
jgi:hypothetical protein